jgi:hypothetical protein
MCRAPRSWFQAFLEPVPSVGSDDRLINNDHHDSAKDRTVNSNDICTNRSRIGRALVIGGLAAVAALSLSACGDDAEAGPRTYVVDAVDFGFEALPETIVAGSTIELTNSSPGELHELVAVRIPDDDTRSVHEILAGDPSELLSSGPPALVIVTPPGGEQFIPVGDGTLTEPGRYAVLCMIPTGVDPATFLEAAAESGEGPPEIPGAGAPHIVHGMHAELTVTAG